MKKKIFNIGVLAHVDAGKTTLTEQMLFLGGAIKKTGSVDKGTAQTDFLDIEKERGISVRSASATLHWKGAQINLIDTPGHIDFSADVERSLSVLDAAILVVSAVEGVQAHTENIWLALKEYQIPTLIFVNKIDRMGADTKRVLEEIRNDLTSDILLLQQSENEGEGERAAIHSSWNAHQLNEEIIESIANLDDAILENYLNGESIAFETLDQALIKSIHQFQRIPVLLGAAKNGLGVNSLMDAIIHYLPSAKGDIDKDFAALVFNISHDNKLGRIVGVRIYNGQLSNRDIIRNATQDIDEKVSFLKNYKAGKLEDCPSAGPGDIVAVCGLSNTQVGDVLGSDSLIPKRVKLNSPLLTVQISAEKETDYAALAEALLLLTLEDPSLQFEWLREDKELHVRIMGWIQMQVLERILESRFNIIAKFGDPSIIYKESPKASAEGYARYWMPKPCWAIIKFSIEPGALGSGVVYASKVGVNKIQRKYQNEIERTIAKALKQGIKGWEVTDLKITLIDGEDHEVHTHPGDFVIATPMAIMNGLINTDTKFLEPYLKFSIQAPEELLGAITSDIIQMRGSFESPEMQHGKFSLKGIFPVATSLDFPVKLSSRSGGKAKIKTLFHGYQECSDDQGEIRPFKGISPLDEAKYILKARKAIQESWK